MKKSNVIILAILAVAAGFFLWLWYYLGFSSVDSPLDLVLAVVWWAVVAALVVGIHAAEKRRRERVRTAYLAPGHLFNSEAGLIALGPGASPVGVLEQVLANLKYNFEMSDFPGEGAEGDYAAQPGIAFSRIVRTATFDKDDAEKWEGEVIDVGTRAVRPFKGKEELANLLAA